ncbi:MAG TPA: hypothetical protein PLD84_14590 [Chitinophagales bacterium]|nr:hypothetical protein [Chitinophagales bacterium]
MIQFFSSKTISLILVLFLYSRLAAEVPEQKDTVNDVKQDTASIQKKSGNKDDKRKDVLILYTGLKFNKLQVSSDYNHLPVFFLLASGWTL